MDLALECRDLCFGYGTSRVLNHISFDVRKGSFCAVLGRNGSGKTTLIHCLNRILTPESGVIKICGTDIHTLSQNRIAQLISLVPQEQMDIFPYAVLDVVVMGRAPFLNLAQRPSLSDYHLAAQALDRLNAGYLAPRNFNRISGGERQISLLARALVQAGHLMLLDEPTNHLDFNNQYHLLGTIKTLCREKGISMIASMHDPNLAAFFADAVVMIKNGEILARGNARDVMTAENISTLYDTDTSGIRLTENCRLFFPDHLLNRK